LEDCASWGIIAIFGSRNSGKIIGHIAFSVVKINNEDKQWYGLGPVSVLPAFQKQGIGSALIKEGLARLRV